jgi:hypothetical protein
MARPRPLFRQRDVTRLLRAYNVAGEPQPIVRITTAGDLIAVPASSAEHDPNQRDVGADAQ